MRHDALERQLQGYGLTIAHILYRMPDHPTLLQTFTWQLYDQAPEFPELHKFLDFWKRDLEGPLHSVNISHRRLIGASEWRWARHDVRLH